MTQPPFTTPPKYVISEALVTTDGATYYRAIRSRDHLPIILKTLNSRHPSASQRARLNHDYDVSKRLPTPYVLKPLDLDLQAGVQVVVLEDFSGLPLSRLLGRSIGMDEFFASAIAIADALAELHLLNVVHKDLKPEYFLFSQDFTSLKLINFDLASVTQRDQRLEKLDLLDEGSLPYLSPELTGRTRRAIDSRSDLYSIGIVFFQMLTGRLPFEARDSLGWIHSHLARIPPSPSSIVSSVPELVSQIVLKLLAKMPEDRYQTARGLQRDLERARADWTSTGAIRAFPLAQKDFSGRLQLPKGIYGREHETAQLFASFDRVAKKARSELILISGYSGIGKTSLIQELRGPVEQRQSLFLSGKFEPMKREIPYSALSQAFGALMLDILALPEAEVSDWQSQLQAALRLNSQLITNVIPEAQLLLGPQPPALEVSPAEAQNRFHMAFRQLVGVFARNEHPLVLFLDDLQWADSGSLLLLKELVTHPEMHNLLIAGAYRDNEVFPSHPLVLTMSEARKQGAQIGEIRLGPLSLEDFTAFIADTLRCNIAEAAPLATLIHEKTGGNPFFAIRFVTSLEEQGLVAFDETAAAWKWDMPKLRAQALTENVIDLMVAKLLRLPEKALDQLKWLACIGIAAEADTLAWLSGLKAEVIGEHLLIAVHENLVVFIEGSYRFLHDRIREAAYSLIPEGERPAMHLHVGRILLSRLSEEAIRERAFEIASHLNQAVALMTDSSERSALRRLNVLAGSKAKASVDYRSARGFLVQATHLLTDDSWEKEYDQTLTLYLDLSECEYLLGNFPAAEELAQRVLVSARSNPDRAQVYSLRMKLYQVAGRYDEAIRAVHEGLRLFGIELPRTLPELQAASEAEFREISQQLSGRRISDLIESPVVTDSELRSLMDLTVDAMPVAFVSHPEFFPLLAMKGVNASLKHGNTKKSCFAYSAYAIILVSLFRDIPSAYEFSDMSLRLNEKFNNAELRGTLLFMHGTFINSWKKHLATTLPILEQGFLASLDVGDLVYAGYNCCHLVWDLIEKADPLEDVARASQKYAEFAQHNHSEVIYYIVRLFGQFSASLQGRTEALDRFDDESFSETQCLQVFTRANLGTAIAYFHVTKLMAAFLHGDHEGALSSASNAKAVLREVMAMMFEATHSFYLALTLVALYPKATPERQKQYERDLETLLSKLKLWAEQGPENHANRYYLVRAEWERIQGKDLEAMRLYDQAIRSARENGFQQNEGLAHELAGAFYLSRGFKTISTAYLREARTCYLNWGAHAKVRQLDRIYSLQAEPPLSASKQLEVSEERLDLLSVIKASQRISGEILLDKLCENLLAVVLERSGAQLATLILAGGKGDLTVEASARTDEDGFHADLQSEPLSVSQRIPTSIIRYVQRTKDRVILDDARSVPNPFSADRYFSQVQARSVLALPILRQNELRGILYLENNATAGVFSKERIATLELLASQAAVSLQNAHLFLTLQEENAERRQAEEAVRVSQQQLQSIIDSATAVIFVRDLKGRYLLVNHRFEILFKVKRESVLGKTDDSLFPSEIAESLRSKDREVIGSRLPLEWEESFPQEDGTHTYLSVKFPLLDLQGIPYAVCGILTDISERKRMEKAREALLDQERQARIDAQKLVQLRDNFISVASHELRTPITPLKMHLQMLKKTLPQMPDASGHILSSLSEALKSSEGQLNHLERLIEDLLDATQISAGAIALNVEEVDLPQVAREVVERYSPKILSSRCSVEIRGDSSLVGRWDRKRLGQVVANLLTNALKYGSGKPIEITIKKEGDIARLSVRDQGIGIPKEAQKTIFDRFERAVSTEHYGGFGLGLYLSREIVRAHGGSIRLESEPGCGTTVTVELSITGPSRG